ncbi:hypothetical protein D9M71_814660 [compost metagenome]
MRLACFGRVDFRQLIDQTLDSLADLQHFLPIIHDEAAVAFIHGMHNNVNNLVIEYDV